MWIVTRLLTGELVANTAAPARIESAIGRDFDPRFRLGVGQVRRVAVDPAAAREDCPGKPGQILRRVKPGLIGKAQGLAGIDAGNRGAVGPFDIDAYLPAGPVLLFESGAILQQCRKQETVDPREIGVDAFVPADRLDAVHGRHLAVVIKPRLFLAAGADQLRIEIVQLRREVSGGARGHSAADGAPIDDDDGTAEPAEFVGGRQAGDAGADHDDIAAPIAVERRGRDGRGAVDPAGSAALVADIHGPLLPGVLLQSPRTPERSRADP